MKISTFAAVSRVLLLLSLLHVKAFAQTGVLNPNDPIVVYNPTAPPATPPWGTLAKWVKTDRVGFNTSSFKSYFYKGMAFRLKFPKSYQHGVNDGKTYPLFIFFHGIGERGSIYDNEYQLYHGGELHRNAVDNGLFDGFLMYPQTSGQAGYFDNGQFDAIADLIQNYFVPQIKVDINRIIVDGLSGGGNASWTFLTRFPQLTAAALPISAPIGVTLPTESLQTLKFTPIWQFQGQLDTKPSPNSTMLIINNYRNAGAQISYTEYPNQGHGCWYNAWNEPDYFPYMLRAHKANPWPLTGRTEFCPGDPINVTMGVTPGFSGYEWRKDGVTIPGANSNQITVNSVGVYECRIRRSSVWSDWSLIPVHIKYKDPTVTPPITTAGLFSKAIPALDSTTGVVLQVPSGYASYQWQKVGSSTTIGTTNTYRATTPGGYRVRVTEQFGCSSEFSAPFNIVDANGPQKPEVPGSVTATTLSKTSIRLDWINAPNPQYNETGFEIYQAEASGGPYKLVAVTAADAQTYTLNDLNSNSTYFFKLRAINDLAASAASNVATATTEADIIAPTAPRNLRVVSSDRSSIALEWDASTDDVGVTHYDVLVNGVKMYSTPNTSFTVYNLTNNQVYNIRVRASDFAKNLSVPSNQVTARTSMSGLKYKYYTFSGEWTSLPNFNNLTPVKTGTVPNVTLTPRTQDDNFAFLWEGYINITVPGNYTFRTNSDDGSKLWIGQLNQAASPYTYSGQAVVNNDGLHGTQDRDGSINLQVGVYPIAMAFYEQGGGEAMTVSWRLPNTGSFVQIPDAAFVENPAPWNNPPAKPTNLVATALSSKSIQLNWTDNSNNETGFELYRATSVEGPFDIIGTAPANTTVYIDSTASAGTTYYYKMKAVGQSGESDFDSNGPGIGYDYYEVSLSALPNFNQLIPVKSGRSENITIAPRLRNDNFAFRWRGTINFPVAGTYTFYTASDDGSKLYVNNTLVVDNDGLHGTQERSGTFTVNTPGRYPIEVGFFEQGGDEVMNTYISGPGLSKQAIPAAWLGEPLASATTLPLPGTPAAPSNLVAVGASENSIQLSWTDNSNDESGFEIYRAASENGNYILLDSVGANTNSYTNTGLVANAVFYYKVRAFNLGGNSPFSNADSATTVNRAPVFTQVAHQVKRYDAEMVLPIEATDEDGGTININFQSLPAFASFAATGNGKGNLTLSPVAIGSMGTYNFTAIATDLFGGADTIQFSVVINDNHTPVLTAVNPVTLSEKQTAQLVINASDTDAGDVLTWSFTGLPAFATTNVNGTQVTVNLAPGYADHGVYTVQAKITDGEGAFDTTTFMITVNDVNPNKTIRVNFGDATFPAATPWNNTAKMPVVNDVHANLKDENGVSTNISITLLSTWTGVNNQGGNTGSNVGVFPDAVIRSSYYTGTLQTLRISGLDQNSKYKLTMMPSRWNPLAGVGVVTEYGVAGQIKTLDAANNIYNTVSFENLQPDASGNIIFTVNKAAGSTYGYLNGLVIESVYDDGTAPAPARNVKATMDENAVQLSWLDAAYNETSYEVYRAANLTGPYTLIYTGAAGTQQYLDDNVTGNRTYYYTVKGINGYGSTYSDTISISTPNISPVLAAIANVQMQTNQVVNVPVTATDTEGDIITLSVSGLPSFASFTDNGNGTGNIHIAPGSTLGAFNNITVTATDNHNASSSRQFSINITPENLTTVLVNFNQAFPVGAPWNSTNSAPTANLTLSNLKDVTNANTGISMTLLDAWTGSNTNGMVTGNNSGIYPDDVIRTFYYESSANTKRIRLSGLSANNRYNLVFFASRANNPTALVTRYSVGAQSVTLDANNNVSGTVKISDLAPDANGQILINIARTVGPNAYIGALEIQYYPINAGPVTPVMPSNVQAYGLDKNRIRIEWTPSPNGQTSYEVWRSTSAEGTFTKVGDVGAGGSGFTNTGVTTGATYYYKVRSVLNGQFSAYSNTVAATTVTYVININMNDGTAGAPPQGGNWNNVNALVNTGFVLPNLINDVGQNTGINMGIARNFSGFNTLGSSTGNNSGVVPDNVMRSFYYNNFGDTAQLLISGLNLSHKYNFTFFGSRANPVAGVSVVSVYKIGNQTVTLNCANNTSNTAQISNVSADENGNVLITLYAANQGGFGYLNSLTISGIPYVSQPGSQQTMSARASMVSADSRAEQPDHLNAASIAKFDVNAYPNPFVDDMTLKFELSRNVTKFTVLVIDMNGRIVHRKELSNVPAGVTTQKLGLPVGSMNRGIYFIKVVGIPELNNRTLKVFKRN
jgi:Predicted peptidase